MLGTRVVRRRVLGTLALAAAITAGTATAGWLAVPVVAGAAGALHAATGRGGSHWVGARATLAAALAWSLLLAVQSARGPLWPLAARLGGALRVPGPGLVLFTVAFATLAAWSAATLAASVVHALRAPLARTRPPG